jgi:glycosyltransferase involved in cell wall biosynthesis
MQQPTISVIIPCFNCGTFISDAVESVKMQRGNFILDDLIIVDDGTDDVETLAALDALGTDPQIKIISNKFSKGPAGARNTGIEQVNSKWIAFLDADDLLTPSSIGARIDAISSNPAIKWCGGDFVKFSTDGIYDKDPVFRSGEKYGRIFTGYHFDRPLVIERPIEQFLINIVTWMGAVLIKTNVLKECQGFKEGLFQSEDTNLFIRIALKHDFLFVPDVVLAKREHSASLSKQRRSTREWIIKNYRSLLKDPAFKPHDKLIRKRLKYYYKVNAEFHLEQGQYLRYLKDRGWHKFFKTTKKLKKY